MRRLTCSCWSPIEKGVIFVSTMSASIASAYVGRALLRNAFTTLSSRSKNSRRRPLSSVTFICASMNSCLRLSPDSACWLIFSYDQSGSCNWVKNSERRLSTKNLRLSTACSHVTYSARAPAGYCITERNSLSWLCSSP